MNELTAYSQQLPDTIEDLSKFVLIGTEKMKSLKAEIRAIEKLHLAKEVYEQKMAEAYLIQELIMDAYVKIGECSKSTPKKSGMRNDLTSYPRGNEVVKSKEQTMKDLGFSKKQMYEFETMAENPDLVEQVKQEARDNGTIPSRSRVIDLAQQRKKKETEEQQKEDNYYAYLDECKKTADRFTKAIFAFIHVDASSESLKMWNEILLDVSIPSYLSEIEDGITKLLAMQRFLKERRK